MNPFTAFQLNPPPVKAPTRKAGPSLADQPLGLELPRRQVHRRPGRTPAGHPATRNRWKAYIMKGEIILEPLRSFGRLTVYRRKGELSPYAPRFTVADTTTNHLIQDFRRQIDADRWASTHANTYPKGKP